MNQELRTQVQELEDLNRQLPQVPIAVVHHFAQGVYAREIVIPAGTVVTGRVHKQSQVNILSAGEMIVTTDEGSVRVTAPFTVVSPPGTKRAAYTLTECVWTTVLGTDLTDEQVIHDTLTCGTDQDYLDYTRALEAH